MDGFLGRKPPPRGGRSQTESFALTPTNEGNNSGETNDVAYSRLRLYRMGGLWKEKFSQHSEKLQNQTMRIILAANLKTCSHDMRTKLSLLSLDSRRRFLRLQLVFRRVHNVNCPLKLEGYLIKRSEII